MPIIERFVPRTEFASYEDFKANFAIDVPNNFDFARDVVDAWAQIDPGKRALVYCTDEEGSERTFSFGDISELSKRAAGWLVAHGIGRGDRVLTPARRRWEYWVIAVALCRIGAVPVPCSIQMTTKDIVYRVQAAKVKMILALDDDFVLSQLEGVTEECPTLQTIALIGDKHEHSWPAPDSGASTPSAPTSSLYPSFTHEFAACEPWEGATDATNDDEMIVYFTSGTTGYPKMAVHNRTYPLGHIVTARYMQCCEDGGLHLTQTDSGWAKFGWGNIYGQWICGSAILGYDPVRFDTHRMMAVLEKYRPTTLCIPPTMYRFLPARRLAAAPRGEHPLVRHRRRAPLRRGEPRIRAAHGTSHPRGLRPERGHAHHLRLALARGAPLLDGQALPPLRRAARERRGPARATRGDGRGGHSHDGRQAPPGPALNYYYRDGELIDPVNDGLYHTGDTAYQDEDGYFWYVGRTDDMIKCSGYRIGPFEIESVLNDPPRRARERHRGRARPHPRPGGDGAVLTLREGFEPSDALTRELQQYVKHNDGALQVPAQGGVPRRAAQDHRAARSSAARPRSERRSSWGHKASMGTPVSCLHRSWPSLELLSETHRPALPSVGNNTTSARHSKRPSLQLMRQKGEGHLAKPWA